MLMLFGILKEQIFPQNHIVFRKWSIFAYSVAKICIFSAQGVTLLRNLEDFSSGHF